MASGETALAAGQAEADLPGVAASDLVIVQPLTITPTIPMAGQIVTATFTIRNTASYPVRVQTLTGAVRGPDCTGNWSCGRGIDFPHVKDLTLAAGTEYRYQQQQTFINDGGGYFAQASYLDIGGGWHALGDAPVDYSVAPGLQMSSPLTFTNPSFLPAELLTITFSVRNAGSADLPIMGLTAIGRGPDCADFNCPRNIDYPSVRNLTLAPGEEYIYNGSIGFVSGGDYFLEPSFQDASDGGWSDIAGGSRITFTLPPALEVTEDLTLSTIQPMNGEKVMARFGLKNVSGREIFLHRVGVSAKGPGCVSWSCPHWVDWPWVENQTLQPDQVLLFERGRIFPYTGDGYFGQILVQVTDRDWHNLGNLQGFAVGSGLEVSQQIVLPNPPLVVGDWLTASFTVTNRGERNLHLSRLGIVTRGPNCQDWNCPQGIDYPSVSGIDLAPGQSYAYQQRQFFSEPGDNYFADIAIADENGWWYAVDKGQRTWFSIGGVDPALFDWIEPDYIEVLDSDVRPIWSPCPGEPNDWCAFWNVYNSGIQRPVSMRVNLVAQDGAYFVNGAETYGQMPPGEHQVVALTVRHYLPPLPGGFCAGTEGWRIPAGTNPPSANPCGAVADVVSDVQTVLVHHGPSGWTAALARIAVSPTGGTLWIVPQLVAPPSPENPDQWLAQQTFTLPDCNPSTYLGWQQVWARNADVITSQETLTVADGHIGILWGTILEVNGHSLGGVKVVRALPGIYIIRNWTWGTILLIADSWGFFERYQQRVNQCLWGSLWSSVTMDSAGVFTPTPTPAPTRTPTDTPTYTPTPTATSTNTSTSTPRPPIWHDNFDDNITDMQWWERGLYGSGTQISETNERAEITFAADAANAPGLSYFGAQYIGACQLRGDFDLQVDYSLLDWPASSGVRVGLGVDENLNLDAVRVVERLNYGGNTNQSYATDFGGVNIMVPTIHTNGKLRLTRQVGSLSGYYFDSDSWVHLTTSDVIAGVGDVYFMLWVWSHDQYFGNQLTRVAFDNIILNSGELVCPSAPTPTPTRTSTVTPTPTHTPTATPMRMDTPVATSTPTATATPTPPFTLSGFCDGFVPWFVGNAQEAEQLPTGDPCSPPGGPYLVTGTLAPNGIWYAEWPDARLQTIAWGGSSIWRVSWQATSTPTATFTQTNTPTSTPTLTHTPTNTPTGTPTPSVRIVEFYVDDSGGHLTTESTAAEVKFHLYKNGAFLRWGFLTLNAGNSEFTFEDLLGAMTAEVVLLRAETEDFILTSAYWEKGTPTATHTASHTPTRTPTATHTVSHTPTSTPTTAQTTSHTQTPTPTATHTASHTPTPTPTATHTASHTATFTPTATHTASHTPTPTPTVTRTPTPTATVPLSDIEQEPNDVCEEAQPIGSGGYPIEMAFQTEADEDWLRFEAKAGVKYLIDGRAPGGSRADLVLEVYASCSSIGQPPAFSNFAPDVSYLIEAPTDGVYRLRFYNQKSSVFGPRATYAASVRAQPAESTESLTIIVAGRLADPDPEGLQANIHNVTSQVYRIFLSHYASQGANNPSERITFLATDVSLDVNGDGFPDVDGLPSRNRLRQAITEWAPSLLGRDQSLTIFLMDHGTYDKFYLDGVRKEVLTPQDLDGWLDELEQKVSGVQVNVIYEACLSGSFIDRDKSISKSGRVIITSTNQYNRAFASPEGALFSDAFLVALERDQSLYTAFDEARQAVRYLIEQQPWLDDDGDGRYSRTQDGKEAARRSFANVGSLSATVRWPPHIQEAVVNLDSGGRGTVKAKVVDDVGVDEVWAVVYPPSYAPPANADEMAPSPPPLTLRRESGASDWYSGLYGQFDQMGAYRVVIYAQDSEADGLLSRPWEMAVTTGWQIFLPGIQR
ncbi:MAG: hypothetical protein KJZ86_00070 [Caldilineaceae bacterium]|nr:hypothetical protein [Caldilineaceae bacterium]